MSFLLDILPSDVLILIVNVWLDDCIKDICALDVAIVNKAFRMRYILTGCWNIKKEGFTKQIHIRTAKNLMAVFKWAEKRGLDIKRIYFKQYCEHEFNLPHLGTLFLHLQEIELFNCFFKLHNILSASLTQLRKLTLHYCVIVVSKEIVVHNNDNFLTNIEELQLFNIESLMYYDDAQEGGMIPQKKQREVYVWIAKCCPKVKVSCVRSCSVSYTTVMQMMQQWPLLKELELIVSKLDQFASNGDVDLLNQEVSTIRKGNLESISFAISDSFYRAHETAAYFLDILLNCCNVTELRSLVLHISNWPAEYSQRLLQSIPNMHQLKHLTFKGIYNIIIPAFVDAVLNHCHTLEALQLLGIVDSAESLMLFQAIPNHCHLVHLTSLHLEEMNMTNESINILCNSVYAKQLTSLSLKRVRGVSIETYQQVFSSFNQLKSFELILKVVKRWDDEMQQKEYYELLLSLLDPLFDDDCAFANTLQHLTVDAFCYDTSKWEDKGFLNEMLHYHVIPYWKFPFPSLQSCHVDLQINDCVIASWTTNRLLHNCLALHTLDWKLMRVLFKHFIQQREMIRRETKEYLKCMEDFRLLKIK